MTETPRSTHLDHKDRCYFTMIPHMADDDLDAPEYRLYGHYRRVCGENGGQCDETEKTTMSKTRLGRHALIRARNSLIQHGLIRIVRQGMKDSRGVQGQTTVIEVIDIWAQNRLRYVSGQSQQVSGVSEAHLNQSAAPPNHSASSAKSESMHSDLTPEEEQKTKKILCGETPHDNAERQKSAQQTTPSASSPKTAGAAHQHPLLALILEATNSKSLTEAQRQQLDAPVEWFDEDKRETKILATSWWEFWELSELWASWVEDVCVPRCRLKAPDDRLSRTRLIGAIQNLKWYKNSQERPKRQDAPVAVAAAQPTAPIEAWDEETRLRNLSPLLYRRRYGNQRGQNV